MIVDDVVVDVVFLVFRCRLEEVSCGRLCEKTTLVTYATPYTSKPCGQLQLYTEGRGWIEGRNVLKAQSCKRASSNVNQLLNYVLAVACHRSEKGSFSNHYLDSCCRVRYCRDTTCRSRNFTHRFSSSAALPFVCQTSCGSGEVKARLNVSRARCDSLFEVKKMREFLDRAGGHTDKTKQKQTSFNRCTPAYLPLELICLSGLAYNKHPRKTTNSTSKSPSESKPQRRLLRLTIAHKLDWARHKK